MKQTLLFDFDGVIADTLDIAYTVSKMIHPTMELQKYKDKFMGNIGQAVFDEPMVEQAVDFHEEYARKMNGFGINPEKKKVLQSLSEKYDFHVISSTNTQSIKNFCEANGIEHYFTDILGFDIEKSKVKKFNMLISKYNLDPKNLIFVTDTVGDIKEAQEVGIGTIIAVADGYHDRQVLEAAHPTHIIDSIVDLEKVIY